MTLVRITDRPLRCAIAGAILAIGVSGCSDQKAAVTATQVAASVNGDEISVHQLNDLLMRMPAPPSEHLGAARRELLDKLVDQQLAVQQALERKLDRTPETILALEAAKREILARAYFEQMIAVQPRPTETDARKFYADHPELFSARRLYELQEIHVAAPGAASDALREAVKAAATLDDVAAWLKNQPALQFTQETRSVAAEQIPLETLSQLHPLKDGQIGLFASPQGIDVIRIAATRTAPVGEADALPQIQKFLENQARHEFITRESRRLRDGANIEYRGEFAPAAETTSGAVKGGDIQRTLEKGVTGLK